MITRNEYTNLDDIYSYYNKKLFDGNLPDCLITYQRKNKACGYYSNKRFKGRNNDSYTDEIALNPDVFDCDDKEILPTLVHEMCHLWQYHFGKPSRTGYHNKEWADKMESVGLKPSNTGLPGGRRTGQGMLDCVIEDSPFAKITNELLENGFKINWLSGKENPANTVKKRESKIKYHCPMCGQLAWAKATAKLMCGECRLSMFAEK